jgi:hypothetical protein
MPGRTHLRAILHLLHIRCHLPKTLKYYSDALTSPLTVMLREASLSTIDRRLYRFFLGRLRRAAINRMLVDFSLRRTYYRGNMCALCSAAS